MERDLLQADRDDLYPARINPIVRFPQRGIVLWGNVTRIVNPPYENPSVFSSINIRRMCNYIRKVVLAVSLNEVFNPNDSMTWASWVLRITPILETIKNSRGIAQYHVIMDRSTITDTDIRMGRMPGKILVMPVFAAEYIPIYFTITAESVYFTNS